MTRPLSVLAGAVALLVVAGVAAFLLWDRGDRPDTTARRYLDAWEAGRYAEMRDLVAEPPEDFVNVHEQMDDALRIQTRMHRLLDVERDGATAQARFAARATVGGLGEWRYEGQLELRETSDGWRVNWAPDAVHPELAPGLRFARTREWQSRAPILGSGDAELKWTGEVISIGMEPQRIRDRAEVTSAFQAHLGVEPARVIRELERPGVQPDHFVPVVDLPPDEYQAVRPQLLPVPGIVFRRSTGRRSIADGFARQTLGRVAEITAERLEDLGDPYQVGDEVGLTGLEAAFERRLSGSPSGEVRLVDTDGNVAVVLHRFEGKPPQPVRTTIDPEVQMAAEAALADTPGAAALVAIDAPTGQIVAVVSHPLDEAFNRSLAGRYPPGSTFKIVTAAGLLSERLTADSQVECPAEITVGGRRFRNFESEALGPISFRQAFAHSCNTTFASEGAALGAERLSAAAAAFGFGAEYRVGVATAGGRLPEPDDAAELAAAAIGQARVVASPVHMASVAGAVSSGEWRPPQLVAEPQAAAPSPRPLTPEVAAVLADLMLEVVASGTGVAAGNAGDVAGKTGTAEFGTEDPPATHAWFVGFRGDLAFAVIVESGGVGGRVAAPIAAKFLAAL